MELTEEILREKSSEPAGALVPTQPAELELARENITGPKVYGETAPALLMEMLEPTALKSLPAITPHQAAWLLGYFHPQSRYHLDEKGAARWARMSTNQASGVMRSPRVAKWVSCLLDGQPDVISRPETRRFLARVITGEESTEVLTKEGTAYVEFPAAARLKALEMLSKLDGYLVDRVEVTSETAARPAWDLSRLTDQQIEFLGYLERLATGEDPGPAPYELVPTGSVLDVES